MAYRNSKRFRGDGRMSDSRIAWVQTILGIFELRQHLPGQTSGDEEEVEASLEGQIGPNVRWSIHIPGSRKVHSFNLTALTLNELHHLRDFLDLAINLAEPVVKQRDEVARRAQAEGDDSFARVYRTVPVFVVREGKIFTYSQGVLYGPPDVSPGSRGERLPVGRDGIGVRGTRYGLADEESSDTGAEDHGPQTDQS